MKLRTMLSKFNLEKVKIKMSAVEMDISFKPADQDAAWELYVEMLTRIVTQPLPSKEGDESKALESVYALFGITREILRRHGRKAIEFSKIAIDVDPV